MRAVPWRRPSAEELMLSNCGSREDSWDSSWTARRSNKSIPKEINPEYWLEGLMPKPKLNTSASRWEEPTHWKRPWCWERLKAGGEGDDRGWDGWMASLTQWTWMWANSERWWRTGNPGVPQSMGLQRVRRDLAPGQQQQMLWNHQVLQAGDFLKCHYPNHQTMETKDRGLTIILILI